MSVNYYDKDSEQLTKLAGSSALVMDSTPSSGSTNPVTSNGIYEALATKQNTLSFDSTPTASSTNPVTSGGVKTALDDKLAKSTISDAYNSATQYGIEGNANNYPTYCINNDVVYECISACVGVAPPNATYWKAHPLAEWIGQLNSDLSELNQSEGTFTLTYDSGFYEGGINSQSNNYFKIGRLVVCNFSFKLNASASSSAPYARFSGLPFVSKYSGITGIMRVNDTRKMLSGCQTSSSNTDDVTIYFATYDGSYASSGEIIRGTLIYYTD